MKNLLLTLLVSFLSANLFAQIGFSGAYSTLGTSGWEDVIKGEGITPYHDGYTIGVDYWFKLSDFRVEFLPEVSYSKHDNIIKGMPAAPQIFTSEIDILSFAFNTQFYIMDMEGDCDCPTWGKEGGFFKKGFFLQAGPGVSLVTQNNTILNTSPSPSENLEDKSTRIMLSAGLGLDIGITRSITITPFGRFRWLSSSTWDSLERLAIINQTEAQYPDFDSSITQLQAGLRLSYRWGE